MDFYSFRTKEEKDGTFTLFPGFKVGRSTDLMVRGGKFYAVWDEEIGLWNTDEYRVAEIVDKEMREYAAKTNVDYTIKVMQNFETGSWSMFQKYLNQIEDNSHQLDQKLTFQNTPVKKTDYVSKRLPYSLEPGDFSAWDELIGTLYNTEERTKIEWFIGSIVAGDSKYIQKFLVYYGPPGSGKSTVMNVCEKLFTGYTSSFEAKALGGNNNEFATEIFKTNPLLAIQQDGNLSRIEDNAKLNSIIAHENMTMNEKFKSSYTARVNAVLMMGTNQPVRISDAKSGLIRRLIDVHPTGVHIPENHYFALMDRIDFELGAIATHCLSVYRRLGKNHYSSYRPLEMMLQTDVFFNFIESYFDVFSAQDGTSLTQAYIMYKEYCSDSGIERLMPKYKFREELRNYFDSFKDRKEIDGHIVRSYYEGFSANKFKTPSKEAPTFSLVVDDTASLFDAEFADQPAQGATSRETPKKKWADVTTKLSDINTNDLHFVKVPTNHIVIDFDLKDESGEKSLERNLEAASNWPPTYAELSKSGKGIHLHYNYDGDVEQLATHYSDGIEVKTLLGDSSLRRRLTKCNSWPVATINSGLPLKEKKVLDVKSIKSEKGLRDMIARNLAKDIHPHTKSSVDFIKKILDDAYEDGLDYNVEDLKGKIITFAARSSNQAMASMKVVQQIKWKGPNVVDNPEQDVPDEKPIYVSGMARADDGRLVFWDIEIYPNLFVLCWKYEGDTEVVRMINPKMHEIEPLARMKLVGFYNRRYDNHILYAALMGYTVEQLYRLSQRIIVDGDHKAFFPGAYDLSYADIWDFSSVKMSLKKWQIELGLTHMEMDIPWDKPVPEDKIPLVVDYCVNDVLSTEAVFNARKQDFVARQILADLSGMSVNDTTQKHAAAIIFGNDRNPQEKFNYTNLSVDFPGYTFDKYKVTGKSSYRGEDPGEGGYVHSKPGMYRNVGVWDIASMHPTSIEQLDLFGEYTPRFSALKEARIAIKNKNYDEARKMLNGKLAPHLQSVEDAKALSDALKIVINSVYGLTSAKFPNAFKDPRNIDNIVAKRGALFMIDLKHAVAEQGFEAIHIKTDSIKIENPTPEIAECIVRFGEKYGYEFVHEATYDRFCLVNDAVYIAHVEWAEDARKIGTWEAVGAQFQQPYVYKTLFSHEEVVFRDFCEPKSVVSGALYLDLDHTRPDPTPERMRFIGKTGLFVPVEEGEGGGVLYRVTKEGKLAAVTGTKGYLWMEADLAEKHNHRVNMEYYGKLVDAAIKAIGKYGDFDDFVR